MSQSFASILDQHAELDELFLCHQEALIALDGELAGLLLRIYRALLATHMEFEDAVLLPLYEQVGPSERAPAILYSGQHRKLCALLDRAEGLVQAFALGPEQPRREVLRILDTESTIKHLNEHHHVAESQALFPILDQRYRDPSRNTLIEQGWAAWNGRRAEFAEAIRGAVATLDTRRG